MADNLENTQVEEMENDNTGSEDRTYTQAEVDKMLLQEGDRRITQYQKSLAKKQREAEKLHNMSAEEKREYELSQREEAILAKENELAMLENKSEGISILADKGLDSKLIDLVIDSDAENMMSKIKLLEKAFKNSVKAEIEKRLGSNAPKNKSADVDTITKELFNKMSLAELSELFHNDRTLYNSLVSMQ